MLVDERTRESLDLAKLSLPPGIPVVDIRVEDYTDSDGEPSLRVTVILDESVDPEKVSGEDAGDLNDAIHDSLIKHGITLFPYIFLAKQSELDATDDED